MEQSFRFWMPLLKAGADEQGRRWIEGIASDEDVDLQGERVVQKGLDLEYFARHGFFNWDHQDVVIAKGQAGEEKVCIGKIGEPTVVRSSDRGLYVKGFLYRDSPLADAAWELARSLEASGASRRLGFSIQGKTLHKEGSKIVKAWIQDIAITPAPVNPRTYLDIAKGLGATPGEFGKALSTGYAKGEDAPVQPGEGGALRPESLEGRAKCDVCGQPGCANADHRLETEKAIANAAEDAKRKGVEDVVPGEDLEKAVADALDKGRFGDFLGRVAGAARRWVASRRPGVPPEQAAVGRESLGRETPFVNAHGVTMYGPDGWVSDPTGRTKGGGPKGSYPTPGSKVRAAIHGRAALEDKEPVTVLKGLTLAEAVRVAQLARGYSRPTAELAVTLMVEASRLARA